MKFLVALCLAGAAAGVPLEDTAEVKAAKADFMAAFAAAEAGEHAALAPAPVEALPAAELVQIPSSYLADEPEVLAAKADFMAAFAAAEAGEHAALAPKPVEALPVPAPVALPAAVAHPAAYWGGYGYGAYPYAYGAYPYGYAGLPVVTAAAAP